MSVKVGIKNRLEAYRNPVYILYALIGIGLLTFSALVADGGVGPLERSLFYFFNGLGNWLEGFALFVSVFGTIGMVLIVTIVALFRKHYANALKILLGGVGAYIFAYFFKTFDIRPRPYQLLDNVIVREKSIGEYGFPSGHVAVATVLAITAYQYLPKKWHRPVTIMAVLVALSRMYMGVHLPLDLVGGFAIGILIGGVLNFLIGSRKFSPVDPNVLKEKLLSLNVPVKSVKLASVDARGSTPYFGTLKDGGKIFVKVVGRENNIADWLFKSWRKLIYRRLEDETPFLNAKRQLEHEAYVSSLALIAGVRTPKVVGIFETEPERWAHAQEAIPGGSLDRVEKKKLTDKVLVDIWQQVQIMHDANVVHRDLRCANVFLAKDGKAWIIDFGFSEAAMPEEAKHRDLAELLASMSTLVGSKRTVATARKVISTKDLHSAAAYLSYSILSSATTSELKKNRSMLPELRNEISKQLKVETPKQVKIQRVSSKNILIIIGVILAAFFIAPKIGDFQESASTLQNARWWLVAVAAVFSILSYVFASLSYRSLIFYPIKQIRLLLIQVASSFASKIAPAGIGGLALNTRFLTKNNHTVTQASSVVAINSFMSFAGHMTLLGLVLIFGSNTIRDSFSISFSLPSWTVLLIIAGFVAVVVILVRFPKIRKRIKKVFVEALSNLKEYRKQPSRLLGSLIAAILVTLTYCGALYASAHALGSTLSPLQILVVFTVGVVTAAATPTPGGIGGAEAGLSAALVSTGMETSLAISIALLFRLITYWLPIIPAFFAFQYVVKKEYV